MKRAIIFGASKLGEIAYTLLKNTYEITCFVDNDKEKWGKELLNLTIIAPNEIKNYKNNSIIIASQYYQEICIQLLNLQITDMKVFKYDINDKQYYIEPLFVHSKDIKEKNNEKILYYYIKYNNIKSCNSKILIVCRFFSPYIKEYIEKLYEYYKITFDILTFDNLYLKNINLKCVGKVYKYSNEVQLTEILSCLNKYDFMHIHYLDPIYGLLAKQISNKCNKLIITIWGSDFYRTSEYEKKLQEPIVKIADTITFDNEIVMKEFKTYFNYYNPKIKSCRFGLTGLEYISSMNLNKNDLKINLNVPENSLVITCGYNANPCHNHKKIIDSLNKLNDEIKKRLFLIFPMTYGREDLNYINNIKNDLSRIGIKFIVLEKFLSYAEISKLVNITDIFIQVQTTDTLSATMQEHLFNGNIIITGSWLPYDILKENKVFFFEVEEINEISILLAQLIENIDEIKFKCKHNKRIIWELSSWENTRKIWIDLYK